MLLLRDLSAELRALHDCVCVLLISCLSESTEYSDWEPDGINLQPPKRRSQRHIKRRRWSSLEASESSDADADERRHGVDKAKVKVKVESDDEETGKRSLRKKSRTRSRKRVTMKKQKRQVSHRTVCGLVTGLAVKFAFCESELPKPRTGKLSLDTF